jgi:hypothetical protein
VKKRASCSVRERLPLLRASSSPLVAPYRRALLAHGLDSDRRQHSNAQVVQHSYGEHRAHHSEGCEEQQVSHQLCRIHDCSSPPPNAALIVANGTRLIVDS